MFQQVDKTYYKNCCFEMILQSFFKYAHQMMIYAEVIHNSKKYELQSSIKALSNKKQKRKGGRSYKKTVDQETIKSSAKYRKGH